MNLLLVERSEIETAGRVLLRDRRAEHLRKVLRAEVGRTLRVGVIGSGVGEGRVLAVTGEAVELQVEISEEPARRSWVDLIVALPRPQALHRILQYAAALGVGRIDLTNAWRVEKSYFSSPALRDEAVRRQLVLGAEQGMNTQLPEVRIRPLLVPFVGELIERPSPPLRLLAHPDATQPIEAAFFEAARAGAGPTRVEVALGPEGGWIDREVETFRGAGFRPVRLGAWILRVETALAAALAQLELLRRLAQAPGASDAGREKPS
ncbi:MAG: 16S rRNA (uracil(1498)-N(3))-methyltransferase [bacterium]|nr:16S rRNA (uracil(1498)-N(3))-methyltransferase [bacterium]